MATLKLKHLALYFLTFLLLYFSQIPGGALLSIAAWFQMAILLWRLQYTVRNQFRIFIYFLTLIPLFLFLGSSSSFILIYLKEGSILFFMMAMLLTGILCFFTALFTVFSFKYFNAAKSIQDIYSQSISGIKNQKQILFISTLVLLILILLPIPMRQDFKISLSIILVHLYLHRKPIRLLISRHWKPPEGATSSQFHWIQKFSVTVV